MAIKMRQAGNIRVGMVGDKHVDWRPITHVSKPLTDAERNYARIEGESLATYYGVWRLRKYLYGSRFTVVTDHKPLQPHYNKIKVGSMRVERHKLRLQGFNFHLWWNLVDSNFLQGRYGGRHSVGQSQAQHSRAQTKSRGEIILTILQYLDRAYSGRSGEDGYQAIYYIVDSI